MTEGNETAESENEEREAGVVVRERYGLVLLLLLGGYLLVGLSASTLVRVLYSAVFLAILLVVLWSPGIPRRMRVIGMLMSITLGLLVLILGLTQNDEAFGITLLILAGLQGLAAFAILYRVAQHDRVGFQTVVGAIAVYAMIGFAASSLYWGLDVLQDGALFEGITNTGDYLYFALITLTTVGYGDVTPIADLSKRLAEIEAFGGQIFLITLVARLVSVWGRPLRNRDQM